MSCKSVQPTECIGSETTLCCIEMCRMLLGMQIIRYLEDVREGMYKCVAHRTYWSRMEWSET